MKPLIDIDINSVLVEKFFITNNRYYTQLSDHYGVSGILK